MDGTSDHDDPVRPAAGLLELIGSVADLADSEPATLTSSQRTHLAVTLADVRGRLDALVSGAVGAVDTHLDHVPAGARSVSAWLAARTELSKQKSSEHLNLHRDLADYPEFVAAWRDGRLGTAKIRLLLRRSRHVETQLHRDQALLIDTIEPLTVEHAKLAIERWKEHALGELDASPDDPEPEPVGNSLTNRPGVNREHVISATLDRRSGHEFERLLQAEIDKAFATGDYTADDGLDLAARRADALLRLMRRGIETKTEFGKLRPSTVNIVDLAALLGLGSDRVQDICLRARETENGTVLSAYELLDDLTKGNLTSVLGFYGIEGRFHPIGTISTNRLASAAQRRLLQIRDGNCMHPGCDQRAHRCVPHHEPPYERTGRTTVDELVLLCRTHHKLRHEGTNRYHLGPDGDLVITTPRGTRLETSRPGRKIPTPGPGEPPQQPMKRPTKRPTQRSVQRVRPRPENESAPDRNRPRHRPQKRRGP